MTTIQELIEGINARRLYETSPEREVEQKRRQRVERFSFMLELADSDPGMADLLDRAEEYYFLKRS